MPRGFLVKRSRRPSGTYRIRPDEEDPQPSPVDSLAPLLDSPELLLLPKNGHCPWPTSQTPEPAEFSPKPCPRLPARVCSPPRPLQPVHRGLRRCLLKRELGFYPCVDTQVLVQSGPFRNPDSEMPNRGTPNKSRPPAKKPKVMRRLSFADEVTTSPVLGLRIKQEEPGRVPRAPAALLGGFVCQLCGEEYPDPLGLAQHRCSRIVRVEYRCPDCSKVFSCPANLASHRRWHKPRPGGPAPGSLGSKNPLAGLATTKHSLSVPTLSPEGKENSRAPAGVHPRALTTHEQQRKGQIVQEQQPRLPSYGEQHPRVPSTQEQQQRGLCSQDQTPPSQEMRQRVKSALEPHLRMARSEELHSSVPTIQQQSRNQSQHPWVAGSQEVPERVELHPRELSTQVQHPVFTERHAHKHERDTSNILPNAGASYYKDQYLYPPGMAQRKQHTGSPSNAIAAEQHLQTLDSATSTEASLASSQGVIQHFDSSRKLDQHVDSSPKRGTHLVSSPNKVQHMDCFPKRDWPLIKVSNVSKNDQTAVNAPNRDQHVDSSLQTDWLQSSEPLTATLDSPLRPHGRVVNSPPRHQHLQSMVTTPRRYQDAESQNYSSPGTKTELVQGPGADSSQVTRRDFQQADCSEKRELHVQHRRGMDSSKKDDQLLIALRDSAQRCDDREPDAIQMNGILPLPFTKSEGLRHEELKPPLSPNQPADLGYPAPRNLPEGARSPQPPHQSEGLRSPRPPTISEEPTLHFPPNQPEEFFTCPYCQKSFRRQAYLRKHLATHAPASHPCPQCGAHFPSADSRDTHRLWHAVREELLLPLALEGLPQGGQQIFPCRHCPASFFSGPGLSRHLGKCHPSESRQVLLLQMALRPGC